MLIIIIMMMMMMMMIMMTRITFVQRHMQKLRGSEDHGNPVESAKIRQELKPMLQGSHG